MGWNERAAADLAAGRTALGIELGSTRIKACLIGSDHAVLATGTSTWESEQVDGHWSYSLDAVWSGLQESVATLLDQVDTAYGVRPEVGALGISAMMHGYLALDAADELLVPFRTWRDTTTGPAAAELTELFGENIPLRWSIAHHRQATLDREPHVARVAHLTTLAGYVHWRLTGERVLGVGDASGMFPIDPATGDYDAELVKAYDALDHAGAPSIADLLPQVRTAGAPAGTLTGAGAALLDPSGTLRAGIPLCPPEGDAGTGMVATNAVAPRTGNVSVGTSVFAMVVLERPLDRVHEEIDVVTTPTGEQVAMVHCNNGAGELASWGAVFGQFASAIGAGADTDTVLGALLHAAADGDLDAGGVLAYNFLAGEPVAGVSEGRPLLVRTPSSRLTLANFARAQLYGVFAALVLGMEVLSGESVAIDRMVAHGGLFRTEGIAQRALAAALGVPVAVGETAAEGGAWGIAVLASYLRSGATRPLADHLAEVVFGGAALSVIDPDPTEVAAFSDYLERFAAGVAVQPAAVAAIR
ncbi:MAG: FGGY-family carbohydrate kinase [Nocardioides sp.]|uniref:xylulokinase n=1 Tax=Nocardioides sp. TaxID=35761 RepID=UPI0039E6CE18